MASPSTTNPPPSSDEQRRSFQDYLSTVNVNNFVSSKLSGDKNSNNYFPWKQQILCLIESQDLLRFIDGTIPQPSKVPSATADDSDTNNVAWRTDRVVKGWILDALSDTVLENVAGFTTARDVWLELEKTFVSSAAPSATPQSNVAEDEWPDYLPLYNATLMGDWDKAKQIIDSDPNAFTLETPLHIAVGTGKAIHFFQHLSKRL